MRASARSAAAAASAREAASAAASAAGASATRAAGAAAGLGRSLSFTRRRSNKADKAEPGYTTESDAAVPPADSAATAESAAAEPAASSPKRVTSASGAMRRTLSFGRRPSDALPRNWKRVTDADGHESFFNALTKDTTLDRPKPLQRHWREAIDKSTGAVYYWNTPEPNPNPLTLTLT